MTEEPLQVGCCPCGEASFRVVGRPLTRFFCHCEICQRVYGQGYADVTAFPAGRVHADPDADVRFQRLRPPPALRRGLCAQCNAPVLGLLTLGPGLRLAFVPARNLPPSVPLPEPAAHIFYHRHTTPVADDLPKIRGYWRSELAVSRLILGGLLT